MSSPTDHVADRVDDLVHGLVDGETAAQIATHCAGCPTCLAALEAAQQRLTALRAEPAVEPPAPLVEKTAERVRAKTRPRLGRRRWTLATAAVLLVAALALGGVHAHYAYLRPSPADLVVLGQSELLIDTDTSVRIRLVNRDSGAPLAGQRVGLTLNDPANGLTAIISTPNDGSDSPRAAPPPLVTDAQGGAEPRFHVPNWPEGTYQLTVTAGGESIERSVRLTRSWQVLLSTDKPVYQPGQTILLRALALRQPDLKPVAGQPATFTITDPKGNVVFKHTAPTSRFGIAGVSKRDGKVENVSCPLADETTEGTWTVACRVGASESRRNIEVLRYVLPKYKVEIKPNKTFYPQGGDVHLDIKATFFTGKPVVDAKVTLKVFDSLYGRQLVTQEKKTNAEGSVAVDLKLPSLPGGDGQVRFEAAVDEGGRVPQTTAVECIVSDRPVRIEVQPEGGTLVEGVPNTVYFVVTHADGRPLPLRLSADGLGTLQCDAAGVASAVVTPTGRETRWTIRAHDDKGDLRTEQDVKLLCGNVPNDFLLRTDKAVYRGGETVRLTALGGGDRPVYVDLIYVGNQRVTLLTQTVPLSGGRGDVSFVLPPEASGTLELSAYRFAGDDRYPAPEDKRNVEDASRHTDGALRKTRLLCVQPASQLQIRTTFSKPDSYRPGETARLDFRLLDANGQPTGGALGLSAVDSAVYAVLSQRAGQERSFVSMNSERLKPITDAAPGWVPGEQEQRDKALLARTAQTLPPGSGTDRASHTLTGESYTAKAATALIQRSKALAWVEWAWVAFVGTVLLAGYLMCWVWLPRSELLVGHLVIGLYAIPFCLLCVAWAFFPGCGSTAAKREAETQKMAAVREAAQSGIEMRRMGAKGLAQPIEGAPGNGLVDEGQAAAGMIGGAPPDEKPHSAPAPRVRQFFPETLLWRPELVTDDEGHASLELTLPDSLTTWKLLASAVGADGRLGAEEREFRVFQPFFVDFDLPVSLTRNDEVEVRVTVFNYLKHAQKVTLTLADDPGVERVGAQPAVQQVEVPEGGKQSVRYRIRAKTVGMQKLEILGAG